MQFLKIIYVFFLTIADPISYLTFLLSSMVETLSQIASLLGSISQAFQLGAFSLPEIMQQYVSII